MSVMRGDSQVIKFEQVSSEGYQVSVAGGIPCSMSGKGRGRVGWAVQ